MSPRFDPANGSVKSESAFQKRNRNIGNVSKSFGKDINDKSSSPGKLSLMGGFHFLVYNSFVSCEQNKPNKSKSAHTAYDISRTGETNPCRSNRTP